MKKLILLPFILIAHFLYGQTIGLIIADKPIGGTIILDTINRNSNLNLHQTTAGQTITIASLITGSKTIYVSNIGSVSVTLSPGGTLNVGFQAIMRWTSSAWSVTIGSSGGGSFASLTGQPTDNANLATALDGKVSIIGDTMTGDISFSPGYKGIVFNSGDIIKDSTNFLNIKSAASGKISIDANSSLTLKSENNSVKINADQNLNIITGSISASTIPYIDASKNLVSSSVTPTELSYSSGVISSIQTQLNAKASSVSVAAKADSGIVLKKANNLSDVGNKYTAQKNLGSSFNQVVDKSANFSITTASNGIFYNTTTSTSTIVVTLDATTKVNGFKVFVRKADSGTGNITFSSSPSISPKLASSGHTLEILWDSTSSIYIARPWFGGIDSQGNLTFTVATNDSIKFTTSGTGKVTINGTPIGSGTVSTVSVATANGFSGTVANATTTPAITIIAGAITPTSVNGVTVSGSSTPTLAVTGTTAVSGSNTGDQTNISGNAATVTTIPTLSGEVSNAGNAITLSNSAVIAKTLTGYISGAGTVSSSDNILQAIQKLNGNTSALVTGVSSVNAATGAVSLTVANTGSTLQWSTTQLQIPSATTSITGLITSTDWNIFNGKQNALGFTPYNSTNPSGYISSIAGSMTGNVTPNSNATYKLGSGLFALNFLYTRNIFSDTSATGTDIAGNNINYATGVGTGAGTQSRHRFRATQTIATGTGRQTLGDAASIGFVSTSSTDAAMWLNITSGSESSSNYAIGSSGTVTHVNGSSGVQLRNNNTTVLAITSNSITNSQTQLFATGTTTIAPFRIPTGSAFKTTPVSGDFDRDANRIRYTNDGLQPQEIILSQQSRVSTQFDKINTTIADITGLTATLVSNGIYRFRATLFVDATLGGGSKFSIGGTATATDIKYQINLTDNTTNSNTITSRQTAIGGSAGQSGTTTGWCVIEGTIVVNAGGTLTVQFAQNAASGTSSVLTGSTFLTQQTN